MSREGVETSQCAERRPTGVHSSCTCLGVSTCGGSGPCRSGTGATPLGARALGSSCASEKKPPGIFGWKTFQREGESKIHKHTARLNERKQRGKNNKIQVNLVAPEKAPAELNRSSKDWVKPADKACTSLPTKGSCALWEENMRKGKRGEGRRKRSQRRKGNVVVKRNHAADIVDVMRHLDCL